MSLVLQCCDSLKDLSILFAHPAKRFTYIGIRVASDYVQHFGECFVGWRHDLAGLDSLQQCHAGATQPKIQCPFPLLNFVG